MALEAAVRPGERMNLTSPLTGEEAEKFLEHLAKSAEVPLIVKVETRQNKQYASKNVAQVDADLGNFLEATVHYAKPPTEHHLKFHRGRHTTPSDSYDMIIVSHTRFQGEKPSIDQTIGMIETAERTYDPNR